MYELKTNTPTRIVVGPAVNIVDNTARLDLDVTEISAQICRMTQDGSAVVMSAFTPTASGGDNDMVHIPGDTAGMYDLELTASQLNFLGPARIILYDEDEFIIHWVDILVLSAAYYDWKYGSTKPEVDLVLIDGEAIDVAEAQLGVNVVNRKEIAKEVWTPADFESLWQVRRIWLGIAAAPNGDVYACVQDGDIYKQTGGIGDFIALEQGNRVWVGIAAAPNGDVYACVYDGDIYKQTGGVGDFVALEQGNRKWFGIAAAPNGDVYATVYGGDIYKQTGGIGDFIALEQVHRNWFGIAAVPNGDVYATVYGGDIYKQTGGIGNFIALEQVHRNWRGIAVAPNGDVYACVYDDDIYKQTGGIGDFIALEQVHRNWRGIAVAPNGDVYAAASSSDIYKLPAKNIPTANQIRYDLDTYSSRLANLNATITSRLAADSYIAPANADVAAIKDIADKLDDTLEDDDGTYRFTEDALAEAPTGGSAPTVSEIWSHETRTLSSFGTLVADIWSNAARTLTSISDSSGVTTLLSRIGAALSFTSGNVNTHLKAKDNLDFGALEKTSLNAATPAVTVSDKSGFTLTGDYDAAKSAASQTSVNAIPTTPLLSTDARLDNLNATISSRLASASYTAPPSASDIRSEIDTNSSKLDVAISTRLAAIDYESIEDIEEILDRLDTMLEADGEDGNYKFTEAALAEAPVATDAPTVTEIRNEMDNNSIKLSNLDATVSSRLAAISYTTPPTAVSIRTEIDANSTKLDVAVGTRLATASYTAPNNTDIENIKAVTDKLDDTLELVDGKNRFTEVALAEGPAADVSAVVDDLVDGFLDAQLTGHDIVGSVGAAIAASSASGDPWATELPGTYATGTAGNIIGTKTASAEEIREELDTRSSKFSILGRILKF